MGVQLLHMSSQESSGSLHKFVLTLYSELFDLAPLCNRFAPAKMPPDSCKQLHRNPALSSKGLQKPHICWATQPTEQEAYPALQWAHSHHPKGSLTASLASLTDQHAHQSAPPQGKCVFTVHVRGTTKEYSSGNQSGMLLGPIDCLLCKATFTSSGDTVELSNTWK